MKIRTIILIFLAAIFIGSGILIAVLGMGKVRHYLHKLEYKISPQKFPNQSKKADFTIYGIDISHHNGFIDWEMVKDKGSINKRPVTFVFIKASEGKSFIDKRFKKNYQAARKEGILCGAYHFYRPEVNSLHQFNNFKKVARLQKGDLPPVLDVEVRGDLSFSRYVEGITNLLKLMENHYGVKPILYTSPNLYMPLSRYKEIKRYPLWLSAFDTKTANRYHHLYHFLQYSEKGKVAGIKQHVDLNGFKGNKLQLQELVIK